MRTAAENVAEKAMSMVQGREQRQGWVACVLAFFTEAVAVGE